MTDVLSVRDADRRKDGHELLGFRCWVDVPDDDADLPHEEHVREVEEYVRRFVLSTAHRTLLFHDSTGELVGVTAFDPADVVLAGRVRRAAWRLEVIALTLGWRGRRVDSDLAGCSSPMKASEFLLRKTFERMLEVDRRRVIVVGRVHVDNRASMVTCARVGLARTERETDDYWRVLGEVDPAAGPIA